MLEHLVDTVLYLEGMKGMIIVSYDPPKIDLEQLIVGIFQMDASGLSDSKSF